MARDIRVVVIGSLLLAVTPAPPLAAQDQHGSITYIADHDVWVTDQTGSRRHRVTDDGTADAPYTSPSQSDDGTIVAVRNAPVVEGGTTVVRGTLHVLDQDGNRLAPPFVPAQASASATVTPTGIPDAQISPDGSLVAYEAAATCPDGFGGEEDCPTLRLVGVDGTATGTVHDGLADPGWSSATRIVAVRDARELVVVSTAGGPPTPWHRPDTGRFAQPDHTPGTSRIAYVFSRDLGGHGIEVRPADLPPDGVVDGSCGFFVSSSSGLVERPGWSPDGRTLVWGVADGGGGGQGVQTLAFPDGVDVCDAPTDPGAVRTVVADGREPHWSAAALVATTPPDTGGPDPDPDPDPEPGGADLGPFDGDPATTARIGGGDPVATAVAISRARFPEGRVGRPAGWAVLSRDDDFADSLAGAPLTARGPMLLTDGEALTAATRDEVQRVLAPGQPVVLLGGTAAIGEAVEAELGDLGYQIIRLSGPSRVETAVVVGAIVRSFGGPQDRVALARAAGPAENPTAGWADSVTGGGWAAHAAVPVLVTPSDQLHPAVADALQRWGIAQTVLLGGDAALAPAVAQAVPGAVRWAGADRAETAAVIAREGFGASADGSRRFAIVNGYAADGWAYGLPAAGIAVDAGAPLLVVDADRVPDATAALVSSCSAAEVDLVVVGGTARIGDGVVAALDALDPAPC